MFLFCFRSISFFSFFFLLGEDVNGGRVEIQAIGRGELKYYKPELISHNLCSLMPNGCPIEKGKTSISVTQGIASDVPVVSH